MSHINNTFWGNLKKPIVALAPMADVTDAAFRRIIARHGSPDIMWTEFVSADGIIRADKAGKEKLMKDLLYTESERPIVAQFFTAHPELMEKAAHLAAGLGFDGIDINIGCPDRGVEKQGAGAALIKNPKLAREIIVAAQRGAPQLPISVKTRIGYNKNEIETWLPELLKENLAAITLHLRTRKEMSKVPAHWDVARRAVEIRDKVKSQTYILGNGDIASPEEGIQKSKETGCDGVMLGRAIFGNPWLWSGHVPSIQERLQVVVEHSQLFEDLLPHKNFAVMKKHYKAYVNGFDGAKELRVELMKTKNATEVASSIRNFLNSL